MTNDRRTYGLLVLRVTQEAKRAATASRSQLPAPLLRALAELSAFESRLAARGGSPVTTPERMAELLDAVERPPHMDPDTEELLGLDEETAFGMGAGR